MRRGAEVGETLDFTRNYENIKTKLSASLQSESKSKHVRYRTPGHAARFGGHLHEESQEPRKSAVLAAPVSSLREEPQTATISTITAPSLLAAVIPAFSF